MFPMICGFVLSGNKPHFHVVFNITENPYLTSFEYGGIGETRQHPLRHSDDISALFKIYSE
jgi:hypothetical protein